MKRLLNISDLNIIDIDKIFKFSNELQVPGTSSNITNKNIHRLLAKYEESKL